TLEKRLTDDINISAVVGFNYRQDRFNRDGLESTNQLVFGFIEHSNFTNQSSVNSLSGLDIQNRTEQRLLATYGEVTLEYRNFLYLNVAARNDWSSTVEAENRSLFYPSASLAFIPTELLQRSDVLDYLKLRVGVGTSAGFPSPYSTRSTLSTTARAFVDRNGNVITTNSNATYFEDNGAGSFLGNPDLQPELHREIEFGAEARLFRNRIGIDLTLYQRRTSDLITRAPIDPSTGFTRTSINIGEIENKGIELGLDITPVRGSVTWNIAGNFYAYESLVTDLGGDIDEVSIAGFTNLGNFAIEGEPFGVMKGSGVKRDENGNAVIDGNGWWTPTDETQIIGNPHPDFTTAVTNSLSWKGFSFSFQFDYRKGGDMYSGTARALLARGLSQDTDFDRTQAFVLDGVKEDGTPNTTMITATNLYFDNYGFGPNEVSVFDATTIRLRDVNLSYRLPANLLENTPFGEVSVTLSGYNLWYDAINFPEHTNVDTDALGFGADGNGLGFEFLNGPSVRRYGASLRVRF
ncbi:MAG: TonB-dependent receptor, partial [Saprospiraceae bacterium]|nr:TonB-dependent receptor [Saprospiraceae bacterium]